MSQFYLIASNGVNQAKTMRGHKTTGITASVNGWSKGVKIEASHNAETGKDIFYIYQTKGSNGSGSNKLIKVIK